MYFATFLIRVFLAIKDGLSDRAQFQDGSQVGWLPWHIFGWFGRDLPIALFYFWDLYPQLSTEPLETVIKAAGLIFSHWLIHIVLYSAAVNYAHWFRWGQRI